MEWLRTVPVGFGESCLGPSPNSKPRKDEATPWVEVVSNATPPPWLAQGNFEAYLVGVESRKLSWRLRSASLDRPVEA
jgi:hypothetical protein